jgi:hypothetical protein
MMLLLDNDRFVWRCIASLAHFRRKVELRSGLRAGAPAIERCRAVIAFANAAGGHDTITAAVLAVPGAVDLKFLSDRPRARS